MGSRTPSSPSAAAVRYRPLEPADVAACERISAVEFHAVDLARARRGDPEPLPRSPERAGRWIDRTTSLVRTDPAGCWVAEVEDTVVGFATSVVRERLWALVTFAVGAPWQGHGIGRGLLERAAAAGAACDVALLSASEDPRALASYWRDGFVLHPQWTFTGVPRRSPPPAPEPAVRPGTAADLVWMDDVDRERRGGPHGPDHLALAAMTGGADAAGWPGLLVAQDRSGYLWATPTETFVVAGREESAARGLLAGWLRRAHAAGEAVTISHVTDANRWAHDLAMSAGLNASVEGFLGVRGGPAPTAYVHNGALL